MERKPHGDEVCEIFRLMKDIPMLSKGRLLEFWPESALVYAVGSEYPLRPGLSGYLWLLRTEPSYFRKVKT